MKDSVCVCVCGFRVCHLPVNKCDGCMNYWQYRLVLYFRDSELFLQDAPYFILQVCNTVPYHSNMSLAFLPKNSFQVASLSLFFPASAFPKEGKHYSNVSCTWWLLSQEVCGSSGLDTVCGKVLGVYLRKKKVRFVQPVKVSIHSSKKYSFMV